MAIIKASSGRAKNKNGAEKEGEQILKKQKQF